jgi:hypothetical protein
MTGVDEKPSAFDCRQREREEERSKVKLWMEHSEESFLI